jgi:hypothetical protein
MHSHWWRLLAPITHNLTFVYAAAGALTARIWQKLRQRRAAAWPSADGTVEWTKIESKHGHTVVVEYRYYARSQYHEGKYLRHFRSKTSAQQFADALYGRHIQVRFQEDNPAISVILEDDLRMTGILQAS